MGERGGGVGVAKGGEGVSRHRNIFKFEILRYCHLICF